MRVYLDFSVFTHSRAVGNVHGHFELLSLPREGETVCFDNPRAGVVPVQAEGFPVHLRVEKVLHSVEGGAVSLSLEDVVVTSIADAQKAMRYFADGFGLHVDEHEQA